MFQKIYFPILLILTMLIGGCGKGCSSDTHPIDQKELNASFENPTNRVFK